MIFAFIDEYGDPKKHLVMEKMPGQSELLNFTELVPLLNKHRLLTQHENYDLLNEWVSQKERANALLYTILPSKGPGADDKFIECIHEETEHAEHQYLAQLFPLHYDNM